MLQLIMVTVQRANIELRMHAGGGSVWRNRKRCSRRIATILVTLIGTVLIFSASSIRLFLWVGIIEAKHSTLGGKKHNVLSQYGCCTGCPKLIVTRIVAQVVWVLSKPLVRILMVAHHSFGVYHFFNKHNQKSKKHVNLLTGCSELTCLLSGRRLIFFRKRVFR